MRYKIKNSISLDRLLNFGFKKHNNYYYNKEAEIKVTAENREVIRKCSNEVFSYLMEAGLLEEIKV